MLDFKQALSIVRDKYPRNYIRYGYDTNDKYIVFIVSVDDKYIPLDVTMNILVDRITGTIEYTNAVGILKYVDLNSKPILVDLSKDDYEKTFGPLD